MRKLDLFDIIIICIFVLAIAAIIISAVLGIKLYTDPNADIFDYMKFWFIFGR